MNAALLSTTQEGSEFKHPMLAVVTHTQFTKRGGLQDEWVSDFRKYDAQWEERTCPTA